MSDHYSIYCLKKLNVARRKDQKVIKTRSMNIFDATAFLTDATALSTSFKETLIAAHET